MTLILTIKQYIGRDKPHIKHDREFYKAQTKYDISDNLPDDAEQAGWEQHESKDNDRNGNR